LNKNGAEGQWTDQKEIHRKKGRKGETTTILTTNRKQLGRPLWTEIVKKKHAKSAIKILTESLPARRVPNGIRYGDVIGVQRNAMEKERQRKER
jgi:hypothetical protein